MFIHKTQNTKPNEIIIGLTQYDENRMNAILTVTYRYGITLVDAIWEFFELEKREVLTEFQLSQNFDDIMNEKYKEYEVEYKAHKTNLQKIAAYKDVPIAVS
jgi:hypothetical protein